MHGGLFSHIAFMKIFGTHMVSTSEMLNQRGTRLSFIGRTRYWKSFCNTNEHVEGTEKDQGYHPSLFGKDSPYFRLTVLSPYKDTECPYFWLSRLL